MTKETTDEIFLYYLESYYMYVSACSALVNVLAKE